MSIGSLGKVMRRSRSKMIAMQGDDHARLFREKFKLGDGDYIEYARSSRTSSSRVFVKARIVEVISCHFNSLNGYTAFLKVMPINQGGGLGCTRTTFMTCDRKGNIEDDGNHSRKIQ